MGDRRKDGESNCNSGDGTGQMAEPWMMFMIYILFLEGNKILLRMTCPVTIKCIQ